MGRRNKTRTILAGLTVLAAFLSLQCGDNDESPLLTPPTSGVIEGVITGTLDWGIAPPYPETVVYALQNYNPSCVGPETSVHITGTYNDWSEDAWLETEGMIEAFPCFWTQELIDVQSDDAFAWKFVTNASWGGSFAQCGDCDIDEDTRRGEVTSGNEDDIKIPIDEDGDYWFLLNTSIDPGFFQIALPSEVPWDTVGVDSSRFTIENLTAGIYTVVIEVPGEEDTYPVRFVRNVRVSAESGTDLETIDVIATGFIRGSVAFADSPSPTPSVDITVFATGTSTVADTLSLTTGETSYMFEDLIDGVYDLLFESDGYVSSLLPGVEFIAGEETNVATVTLERSGGLAGSYTFDVAPDPVPAVTFEVREAGDSVVIASGIADSATATFLVEGLNPGQYDVLVSARTFQDVVVEGVTVFAGQTTPIGEVTLAGVPCESEFSAIQVLGEFNDWNLPGVPSMIQVESCVWVDTMVIGHGCYLMKFVTDGGFDSPADYGTCTGEDNTCSVALSGDICSITGFGTALGKLNFTESGTYEFRLDEGKLTYSITKID